jgi:hypothetical protein
MEMVEAQQRKGGPLNGETLDRALLLNVVVTTLAGTPPPVWLSYIPSTKTVVAKAIPDGAFPMQLVVNIGGGRTSVVISERSEP